MSFKKLRLDPELRQQPGPSGDGAGRGYLDGSSFSSSTSGGSGAYGRSTGPFRTRYSQPLGTPSPGGSSFSRFAPYYFGKDKRTSLRVPLIRARRDDSDSEGQRPSSRASLNSSIGGDSTTSATSTTAQRIIETLQNLSTPVMNAGKIRIDQDIKAVQPLPFGGGGGSFSRTSPGSSLNRSTGPPKMCSSLLLSNPSPANQTSPMFYPGDRRLFCIPRMVDAATNTDNKEEASSPPQLNLQNKSVTLSAKSQYTGTFNLKPVEPAPKDDNNEEVFHECNSDFVFSNPWAPDVFEKFLTSGKEDKSTTKGTLGIQQRINGYTRDTSSCVGVPSAKGFSSLSASTALNPPFSISGAVKPSSTTKASSTASFSGSGVAGSFSFGSSPLKDSSVAKSSLKSSTESKNDSLKPFGSTAVSIETPKTTTPFAGFTFGKASSSSSSPLKSSSEPSSKLFAFGNKETGNEAKSTITLSTDTVDTPKTDKPAAAKSLFGSSSLSVASSSASASSTLAPLSSLVNKQSSSKWRCPTCMVENDPTVAACVCCSEKNPNPAPKPEKKKWRCPTCMVDNDPTVAACVCCSEKNPNPVQVSSSSISTTTSSTPGNLASSKKWNCPTCMVPNEPTVANCVCCSEKNPNPVVSEKKNDSAAAGTAAAPTFKFGVSNLPSSTSTSSATSSGSFVFGAPTQSDTSKPPATGSFSFGLPSTTSSVASPVSSTVVSSSSTVPVSTATGSTFKFGSTAPSSTPSLTPAPTFGFTAPATTASSSVGTSANTQTTAATSLFTSPKVQESSTSSTTGIFGAGSFGTSQSTTSSSFKFGGSSSGAPSDAPKPSASNTFSFGSAAAKTAFNNSFSFGGSSNPSNGLSGATSSISTPAPGAGSTPTPAAISSPPTSFNFGASNPTPAASPFGQLQTPQNNAASTGLFTFGGGSTNPAPPTLTPTPTPSFSLTPNLNFGSTPGSSIPSFGNPTLPTPTAGSQPPPALFQFNSTPTAGDISGRKIKKATRRFNK